MALCRTSLLVTALIALTGGVAAKAKDTTVTSKVRCS